MKWYYLQQFLHDQGFAIDYRRPKPENLEIDDQVGKESKCPTCGHQGMQLYPFFNSSGQYAPVLACLECHEAFEI